MSYIGNPVGFVPLPATAITVLAFRNRFSASEKAAITLAGRQATPQGAAIQSFLDDVAVSDYIDTARTQTRGGTMQLETLQLIAFGRAEQILDAPIQPHERPRG